jgi:hypothetical protein
LDKGIDKSQIDQAIRDLDSSDKDVRCKAFNFLLARVKAEIAWHDLTHITNKLVELASSPDVEIRQRIGSMCNDKICNTNPELALTLAILSETEDKALRNEIKSDFRFIGSKYPIKCLEIIQRWLRTNVVQIGDRL